MVHKIISGFQMGADIAGIRAALDLGLQTGGMMPKGFITKWGPRPKYEKYGAIEHPSSSKYPGRTKWNVKNSDATLRFAFDFTTAGEVCTLNAINQYEKPYFDINLHDIKDGESLIIFKVVDFLEEHNVEVLNVAGNCGDTQRYAKRVFDITRPALRAYVSAYNKVSTLKDVWTPNDIG